MVIKIGLDKIHTLSSMKYSKISAIEIEYGNYEPTDAHCEGDILLGNIPDELKPKVTKLEIFGIHIQSVYTLSEFTGLEDLNLQGCGLKRGLKGIERLKNLKSLDVSQNLRLYSIDEISELNLEVLDAHYSNLSDISCLQTQNNLTELYIDGNSITDYSVLLQLPKLKHLSAFLYSDGTEDNDHIRKILNQLPNLLHDWCDPQNINSDFNTETDDLPF